MTEYQRWPHQRDQRLLDAMRAAGLEPWQLADPSAMHALLQRDDRSLLRAELAHWAGRHLPLERQLARARDNLLCEPVYYLKTAADTERNT